MAVCPHRYQDDGAEYICVLCGDVKMNELVMVKEAGDCSYLVRPVSYSRRVFLGKTLDNIWSQHNTIHTESAWKIRDAMGSVFTWSECYRYCHDIGVGDNFNAVPNAIGFCPQYPHNIIDALIRVQQTMPEECKKAINNLYCIFKFNTMYGLDTEWIPIRLKQKSIDRIDGHWKVVCERNGWVYKDTVLHTDTKMPKSCPGPFPEKYCNVYIDLPKQDRA